jgi:hypothetical protein
MTTRAACWNRISITLGRKFAPRARLCTRVLAQEFNPQGSLSHSTHFWCERVAEERVYVLCTHLVLDIDEQLRDGAAHQNHQQQKLPDRSRGPHGCRRPRLDPSVWTQSDLASAVMQTPSRTIIWFLVSGRRVSQSWEKSCSPQGPALKMALFGAATCHQIYSPIRRRSKQIQERARQNLFLGGYL